MQYDSQYSALVGSSSDGQDRATKRQRTNEPVRYTVSLNEAPGAVMQVLNLDSVANMGHISQWNDQLMTLLLSFQHRVDELSAAPEPVLSQLPAEPASQTPTLLKPVPSQLPEEPISQIYVPLEPTCGRSDIPTYGNPDNIGGTSPLAPSPSERTFRHISGMERIDYEAAGAANHGPRARMEVNRSGKRSMACRSDYKHSIRRVYTIGLMRPRDSSMRLYLQSHGIDSTRILYSHHIAYTVNEFFVKANYVVTFVTKLGRMEGVTVLKFFDPLSPSHIALSYEQQMEFPGIYRTRINVVFRDIYTPREGFQEYAKDYKREVRCGA